MLRIARTNKRRGSAAGAAIAGVSLFGVVVAALFMLGGAQEVEVSDAVEPPASSKASKPTAERNSKPATQAKQLARVDVPQQLAGPAVDLPPVVEQAVVETPEALVAAHIAAGEFGPALNAAKSEIDPDQKALLMQEIARAQMKAREFQGALMTIRQMESWEEGSDVRAERATEIVLGGGGMGADFTELRELIQGETSGQWEEVDGTGGTISEFSTGVFVDPNGLMKELSQEEKSGRLNAVGVRARKASLNQDMARASDLRLVSLTRLEAAVAKRVNRGQPVVESMKQLAGLSQIKYVFVYPESGEIVIGGPAEGWEYNSAGQPVGIESGRPTLQLDDFVTVLRVFSPGGGGVYQCLIKPTPNGLERIQEFVAETTKRPLRPGQVRNWVQGLQDALGMQDVQVNGVMTNSRVARVIVEADYRMKMIGVDRLEGATGKDSYFDVLSDEERRAERNNNSLAMRWWLTMKYDSVSHSPSKNVFEINGSSVQCLSENEFITRQGTRVHTGATDGANTLFAHNFTKNYAELAKKDLVFADLQNIFDLSMVAALVRNENLDRKAGWSAGVFDQGGAYKPETYQVPTQVMTVANHRVYNGRDIVVQVAGGVEADFLKMLKSSGMMNLASKLTAESSKAKAPQLPAGRWWWDAAE